MVVRSASENEERSDEHYCNAVEPTRSEVTSVMLRFVLLSLSVMLSLL